MTTINNFESLIEKVGGIEKAREIVSGAPAGAHLWRDMDSVCTPNEILYYAWFGGALLVFEDGKGWVKSIYHDDNEYILDQLQDLNDLRTAIAEHDEQIKCWSCNKYMTKSQHSANDGFCIHCSNEVDL